LRSRPVEPSAAPKRAGELRTETPGSKRIRSLMSVTSSSSMSLSVMTETVAGTSSTDCSTRVAVTVIWLRASLLATSSGKAGAVCACAAPIVTPMETSVIEEHTVPAINRKRI
jgi:hypothetical protein